MTALCKSNSSCQLRQRRLLNWRRIRRSPKFTSITRSPSGSPKAFSNNSDAIVSLPRGHDQPPLRPAQETNYRTEFIIALNNQPQGGILTRAATRSPDVRVGFWSGWGFNNTPARGGQYYDPRQNNRTYYQRPQGWW